jgi:hypothetical protein
VWGIRRIHAPQILRWHHGANVLAQKRTVFIGNVPLTWTECRPWSNVVLLFAMMEWPWLGWYSFVVSDSVREMMCINLLQEPSPGLCLFGQKVCRLPPSTSLSFLRKQLRSAMRKALGTPAACAPLQLPEIARSRVPGLVHGRIRLNRTQEDTYTALYWGNQNHGFL